MRSMSPHATPLLLPALFDAMDAKRPWQIKAGNSVHRCLCETAMLACRFRDKLNMLGCHALSCRGWILCVIRLCTMQTSVRVPPVTSLTHYKPPMPSVCADDRTFNMAGWRSEAAGGADPQRTEPAGREPARHRAGGRGVHVRRQAAGQGVRAFRTLSTPRDLVAQRVVAHVWYRLRGPKPFQVKVCRIGLHARDDQHLRRAWSVRRHG